MTKVKVVQTTTYLVTGLLSGLFAIRALSMAVWGVHVNPIARIALLGSIGLLIAAIASVFKPDTGRKVAIVSLLAMATFWIPAIRELAPLRNTLFDFKYFFALGFQFVPFFTAAFFALLYPTHPNVGITAAVCLALSALGVFVFTTGTHAKAGEYSTPQVILYKWVPGGSALTIKNGFKPLDKNTVELLSHNGINGTISWSGGAGNETPRKLIFLVAGQIPASHEARFPREGTIVHAFDGTNWHTIPSDAQTYTLSASLEPQGKSTQCWMKLEHGRGGCTNLEW